MVARAQNRVKTMTDEIIRGDSVGAELFNLAFA
jgi:hypothetical protein